ncbi:MAG: arginine repressor [Rhodothermales bacterium]|nr:arginine repressor [Rhodothermales bacterium]
MPETGQHKIRRKLIRNLVREQRIESQGQLLAELAQRNISIGQSSISRDLEALNVVKVDGRYTIVAIGDIKSESVLSPLDNIVLAVLSAGPNLTVLKTLPGGAQRVAHAIDSIDWNEVVGTVAGDDTVFVATATSSDQDLFMARIRSRISR